MPRRTWRTILNGNIQPFDALSDPFLLDRAGSNPNTLGPLILDVGFLLNPVKERASCPLATDAVPIMCSRMNYTTGAGSSSPGNGGQEGVEALDRIGAARSVSDASVSVLVIIRKTRRRKAASSAQQRMSLLNLPAEQGRHCNTWNLLL